MMLDRVEWVFYNGDALEWVDPIGGPRSFVVFWVSPRACGTRGRQPQGWRPLAFCHLYSQAIQR